MIEKIKQNVGVVALIVAILAFGISFFSGGTKTIKEITKEVPSTLGGSSNFDRVGQGDNSVAWHQISLGSGVSQGNWRNTVLDSSGKGQTVYVDLSTITTSGTASSSFALSAFATSTATVGNAALMATLPGTGDYSINRFLMATSSGATTTNSISTEGKTGVVNGVVAVPYLWYFTGVIQRGDANCFQLPAGAGCEAATSTNRGFDATVSFREYATTTSIN